MFHYYQALQLQYLAFHLGPGVSHLCLALNDFLRAGLFFFIFIPGSPNPTFTTLPLSFLTYTARFLGPPGV